MRARRLLRNTLAALWLGGLVCANATAAVYRCGNAYADVPCPQATLIDADDPRSEADQAAARRVAAREAALASRMSADREDAERLSRPAVPVRVKAPVRAATAASAAARARQASRDRSRFDVDGNFVAIVPRKR